MSEGFQVLSSLVNEVVTQNPRAILNPLRGPTLI